MEKRLIIVSRHLPWSLDEENGIQLSSAIPASTLSIHQYLQLKGTSLFSEVYWAGIPDCNRSEWPGFIKPVYTGYYLLPVFVPSKHLEDFKSPVNNEMEYSKEEYECYQKGILLFTETLLKMARPADTIWIMDEDLASVSAILRKELPGITISICMQTTFPAYETFGLLSRTCQQDVLKGMLGADVIAFIHTEYAANFLQCLLMVLGLDNERQLIHYEDRLVMAEALIESLSTETSRVGWPGRLIKSLDFIKKRQQSFQVKFLDEYTRRHLYDAYRHSKKRLILLDYDGTLVGFSSKPDMAVPGKELLQVIHSLSANAANDVFLVSGRNSAFLEQHFGNLPVSLIAEHGASYKWKYSHWMKEGDQDSQWKSDTRIIMQHYVHSCKNSFIEEKEFSIAWHYRNADNEGGRLKAFELASELKTFTRDRQLQVMMGKKIVELRQSNISKGNFVRKLIRNKDYDYIFAAGDDRTDEDMFIALMNQPNAFTIKVGPEASYAEYNLHTPQMILSLLLGFDHLSSVTQA